MIITIIVGAILEILTAGSRWEVVRRAVESGEGWGWTRGEVRGRGGGERGQRREEEGRGRSGEGGIDGGQWRREVGRQGRELLL